MEKQIDIIKTVLRSSVVVESDINEILMLYIYDQSFDRGAICRAEKEFRSEFYDKEYNNKSFSGDHFSKHGDDRKWGSS